jgi:hypothetical protein
MSFIRKIIGPDETLIGISSAHWIYGATGLAWLGASMIIGLVLNYYAHGLFDYLFMDSGAFAVYRIANVMFWIPTAFGIVMFLLYFLMMISPEIGLTSKRVIYKRGIIFVDVKEVDLEELKAANVDNGYLGRFFNYGYVVFDARFVEGMDLPAIGHPYRFVKALNDAKSHLKEDSMTVVLEGVGDAVQNEIAQQTSNAQEESKKNVKQRKAQKKQAPQQVPQDEIPGSAARNANDVVRETIDNTKRALKGSPLSSFRKDLPKAGPAKEEGPIVFNDPLIEKQRKLHDMIKDNFSDTTH